MPAALIDCPATTVVIIARRFNGPTDAFNHFAQDAVFNRSGYRQLEDRWARALARGEKVHVSIGSTYTAQSKRPDDIYVSYTVGGIHIRKRYPNHSARGAR